MPIESIIVEGYIVYSDDVSIGILAGSFCFYFFKEDIINISVKKTKDRKTILSLKKNCRLINLQPSDLYKNCVLPELVPFPIASRSKDKIELKKSKTLSSREKKFTNKVRKIYHNGDHHFR